MKATLPFIEDKFDEFNGEFFGGSLSRPVMKISRARSYLGICAYKRRRVLFKGTQLTDFRILVNGLFDLPQEILEDILIHEMIHYHILSKGIRDTSPHGKIFRGIAAQINSQYGRHIRISYRLEGLAQD